jgi:hypothetical protein
MGWWAVFEQSEPFTIIHCENMGLTEAIYPYFSSRFVVGNFRYKLLTPAISFQPTS